MKWEPISVDPGPNRFQAEVALTAGLPSVFRYRVHGSEWFEVHLVASEPAAYLIRELIVAAQLRKRTNERQLAAEALRYQIEGETE